MHVRYDSANNGCTYKSTLMPEHRQDLVTCHVYNFLGFSLLPLCFSL